MIHTLALYGSTALTVILFTGIIIVFESLDR